MNEQEKREKVIKALELCTSKIETRTQIPCETCPYHNRKYHGVLGDGCCNARSLQGDALALLKAQEPMKPIRDINGVYYCGNCDTICVGYEVEFTHSIIKVENYCHKCGRAVKWE